MPLVSVALPPGYYANGTEYQSQGRYYDGNLIRFYEGQIRPIGGWRVISQVPVNGAARELTTWRANDGTIWAGIGTSTNLYVMSRGGDVSDITPAGFTAGIDNAVNGDGYGANLYSAGIYGQSAASETNVIGATVWSLDQWGENLVAVAESDGTVVEWVPPTTAAAAAPVANAPSARFLLVTDQNILMLFGADGDVRKVRWSDQANNTEWTAAANNQAGEFFLETEGEILKGVKTPRGALIFTDADVWLATYVGPPFVYTFERVAQIDGPVTGNAVVLADSDVFWMGANGFYSYTGIVRPLQCDVSDRVFSNINRTQLSKVTTFHNSAFGEVWWFYPDDSAIENNSYVIYSYREGHWTTGKLDRLSAIDRTPFNNPLAIDERGVVFEHEIGTNRDGLDVFLEGGPIELGEGDRVHHAHKWLPDQNGLSDGTVRFITRIYPQGDECEFGPYPLCETTDVRISGRQTKVRYDMITDSDFRIGDNRVDVKTRGRR